MKNQKKKRDNNFYSLIPLEDFKAVLGIDDREDKMCRFCLVTSTLSIEQYCKRKFIRKKYFERIEYTRDLIISLREFPVSNVLAVYALSSMVGIGEFVEPDFYNIIPDCGTDDDLPFHISFSPALQRYRGLSAFKVVYWAGYTHNKIPADLSSACFELAAWNFNRYRGRRIGMTGSVRKDGEQFEISMPENVRLLLEPYKRKTI
jgi:hypothetical protein